MWLPAVQGSRPYIVDVRGPVAPVGPVAIVDRQSVQAPTPSKSVSPTDNSPGVGQWIWLPAAGDETAARFRKLISLSAPPKHARIWISAEVRYRLWINGHLASRGPADIGRDYDSGPCGPWFDDVRDVTRFLHSGANVVAVEVFRRSLVQSDAVTGKPGLKFDLAADGAVWGSDSTWSCASALDLSQTDAKRGFRVDMNLEPINWQASTFDDTQWSRAANSKISVRKTIVSELAPPLEAIYPPVNAASTRFDANGEYRVRYGHVLSGYVSLRVQGHRGARLLVEPNEHDASGGNRKAEIVLRDGEQIVELPYFDSYSVINLRAEGVKDPIVVEEVRSVFTSYPVQYLGSFECSNSDLNRMWRVCRWVTQICMQTHHLDSPHHQEPISDAGDYLIESLNSFYAFGEGTLARQDLKKIARTLEQRNYQSFHTSYSLLWLRMLMQYFQYTGDAKTVEELAPYVFKLLARFETYIGKNGLISEAPNYMFMDWVQIEGFNAHHPPAVIGQGYLSAMYVQALADGIEVAKLVRDSSKMAHYASKQDSVKSSFETELWSSEQGLYRDGRPNATTVKPNQWLPADKAVETFTTQVNCLAVACGIADQARSKDVMRKVLGRPDLNCQPYFMHFLFDAVAKAGIFDSASFPQLARWKVVEDSQSYFEMWDTGDLSHAWNATPLFQMSGRILGVEPIEPGFKKFQIAPKSSGLTWAKGRVPTPCGPIDAEWHLEGKELILSFTVPRGLSAVVNGQIYTSSQKRIRMPK